MTEPTPGPLSHLAPIETRTRGVAILAALARMVERAGLTVGDRLPPEVQLAEQLGVGRSTVREALNRWEGMGLIRRRRGDGTYLAAPIPSADGPVPMLVMIEGEAVLRLLEVRRALERDVARLAAQRATAAQKAAIAALCDTLLAIVAEGRSYQEADRAFHHAISEASGNPLFTQILTRLDQSFERSRGSPFDRSGFGVSSFPFHRDLSDAIDAGDADRAARAVDNILDSVDAEVRETIAAAPSTPGSV